MHLYLKCNCLRKMNSNIHHVSSKAFTILQMLMVAMKNLSSQETKAELGQKLKEKNIQCFGSTSVRFQRHSTEKYILSMSRKRARELIQVFAAVRINESLWRRPGPPMPFPDHHDDPYSQTLSHLETYKGERQKETD